MKQPQKRTLRAKAQPRRVSEPSSTKKQPKKASPHRVAVVFLLLAIILLAVTVRAFVLQVRRSEPLKRMAEEQYLKEIEIPARRGAIYDRAGNALAVSNQVDSIYAHPHRVGDAKREAAVVAKKLSMKPLEVEKKLQQDRLFVWLKRRIDPKLGAEIKALGLPSIGTVAESRRYYPNRTLFSHVLGTVDLDGRGIEGLESVFETELAGVPQTATGLRDARGRVVLFDGSVGSEGVQGSDVYLTVDREIQTLAAQALAEGVQRVKGKSGSAVVMDPRTGDILALANYPEFNPNSAEKITLDVRRNRAVSDMFEPGSTMKSVLMAAAVEEGIISATDQVFCENGVFRVGGETIHDTHPHGTISAKKIIASSSNIGVAKIAVQLGRERFGRYLKAFGFGGKSGIELPGEATGMLRPSKKWPLIQLATIAFGQGISVTTMQMAQAYAAIANGGVMQHPRLVRTVQTSEGAARVIPRPAGERVMSTETAKTLTEMLKAAVNEEGGTGGKAAVNGVITAGKTATAQKVDSAHGGGYAPDKYVASFIGFLPADEPRVVIVVTVDEPEKGKHFGGTSAAPIFQEIAAGTLQVLGLAPASEVAIIRPSLEEDTVDAESVAGNPMTEDAVAFDGSLVPDFRGLSLRDAIDLLKRSKLGLQPDVIGSGKVVSQEPAPGSKTARAKKLRLTLSGGAHALR